MKLKTTWQYLGVAMAATAIAGPAPAATLVAGWNFSQYAGDGDLDTGSGAVDTLPSNYSNRMGGDGAGVEANPYGTLYMNGQFGSSNVDEAEFPPVFGPSQATGGSLTSNLNAPQTGSPVGQVAFDAPCGSQNGQTYCQEVAMLANPFANLNIVFAATLLPDGLLGQDWTLSFAGKTLGGSQNVTIDFSLDGTTYGNAVNRTLTTTDAAFNVDFSAVPSDLVSTAYMRFTFNSVAGNEPLIDNVAILAGSTQLVPEPGTAMLLLTGLLGLGMTGRRERA